MSKGNLLLGQARGKVGDVVFSVLKGQQITKTRNRKPNNPRTVAQMAQRVKLSAVVSFYKRNTDFFPFSFTGKLERESDYNAFVKYNLNISPYLTKPWAMESIIIPAPWILTRGPLSPVIVSGVELTPESAGYVNVTISLNRNNPYPDKGLTFDDALRQTYNMADGDMLTIAVWGMGTSRTATLQRYIYQYVCGQSQQMLLDRQHTYTYNIGYNTKLYAAEGSQTVKFTVPLFNTTMREQTTALGAAAVISRNDGGKVIVGDSQILLNATAKDLYLTYRSEGILLSAIESYGVNREALLDPLTHNPLASLSQFTDLEVSVSSNWASQAVNEEYSLTASPIPSIFDGTYRLFIDFYEGSLDYNNLIYNNTYLIGGNITSRTATITKTREYDLVALVTLRDYAGNIIIAKQVLADGTVSPYYLPQSLDATDTPLPTADDNVPPPTKSKRSK